MDRVTEQRQPRITLGELLDNIKVCVAGYGRDIEISHIVMSGISYVITDKSPFMIQKYGRGAKREHDLVLVHREAK
ncbi:MAG: hypothetical protein WC319_15975 [Candidatus Paceibacterota bacterium]|jgi:hypothetical protein